MSYWTLAWNTLGWALRNGCCSLLRGDSSIPILQYTPEQQRMDVRHGDGCDSKCGQLEVKQCERLSSDTVYSGGVTIVDSVILGAGVRHIWMGAVEWLLFLPTGG